MILLNDTMCEWVFRGKKQITLLELSILFSTFDPTQFSSHPENKENSEKNTLWWYWWHQEQLTALKAILQNQFQKLLRRIENFLASEYSFRMVLLWKEPPWHLAIKYTEILLQPVFTNFTSDFILITIFDEPYFLYIIKQCSRV